MRKYKRTYRVDSESVQGEGSFVEFKNLTWGEAKEFFGRPSGDLDNIAARIADWNWTDEDGQPLPLPSEKPEIMQELMAWEVSFLVREANRGFSADDVKN